MIISKTPFRMSFFGGGTDMPEYFKEKGGSVISTTFDKYCYVNVRNLSPFFDYSSELVYSAIERVTDTEEIEHPAIREAMKMMGLNDLRLIYDADLPAKSGLGTSSSFAVGMLNAFHAMKGQPADKQQLAKEAIYLERVLCKEAGGWQDQIAAAYGGLNRIDFEGDKFTVSPVIMSPERKKELNNRIMMFFTGRTRSSHEIHELNKNSDAGKRGAALDKMKELVDEAYTILTASSIELDEFGRLLHYNWSLKRQTGKYVSTNSIDALYDRGIRAGALGGKLLGAGKAGFLIFYVPEGREEYVRRELSELMYIPFSFENRGTQILYSDSDKAAIKDSALPSHC